MAANKKYTDKEKEIENWNAGTRIYENRVKESLEKIEVLNDSITSVEHDIAKELIKEGRQKEEKALEHLYDTLEMRRERATKKKQSLQSFNSNLKKLRNDHAKVAAKHARCIKLEHEWKQLRDTLSQYIKDKNYINRKRKKIQRIENRNRKKIQRIENRIKRKCKRMQRNCKSFFS